MKILKILPGLSRIAQWDLKSVTIAVIASASKTISCVRGLLRRFASRNDFLRCLRGSGLSFIAIWFILGCAQTPAKMEQEAYKLPKKEGLTNSMGMEFIYISPGSFLMGSPGDEIGRYEDENIHRLVLTKGFYLQTTEVTQGQWKVVMGNNPSEFTDCGNNCPVEKVSWEDCKEFIQKLNQRESTNTYRLPTEAEWEYACRAGTNTPFSSGECLTSAEANYDGTNPLPFCPEGTFREKTTPVRSFPSNAWGFYDMHGNVWEWCEDLCEWNAEKGVVTDTYQEGIIDPLSKKESPNRIIRGGSWLADARVCRCAFRLFSPKDRRDSNLGFRLAKTP